ncbi:hypothetical protein KC845_04050 [Candidatus Kaiserbacteria bacterium]|nr:hypothetical protein [Candidatus Kaiserbacteria bacterium]
MVRNLIFKIFSKSFHRIKNESWVGFSNKQPELIQEYESKKSEIDSLVKKTRYWHGTGRYQYQKSGKSKYEGVSNKETFDVLEKILNEHGLKPHYDPWAEKYVKTPYSISLANQWGYGKMYAHYHLDENKKLSYEIAPITFWFRVIIWIQLTENYFKFALGFFILYAFSSSLQNQGKVWLSTFRSDTNKKWPYWKILTAQSDIKDNYSILFGIKDDLETLEIPKILRFLETRTDKLIDFDKITFVAVPAINVGETEVVFKNYNIKVEIFSLELLEIYMRQYSLKEIMTQSYRLMEN